MAELVAVFDFGRPIVDRYCAGDHAAQLPLDAVLLVLADWPSGPEPLGELRAEHGSRPHEQRLVDRLMADLKLGPVLVPHRQEPGDLLG